MVPPVVLSDMPGLRMKSNDTDLGDVCPAFYNEAESPQDDPSDVPSGTERRIISSTGEIRDGRRV